MDAEETSFYECFEKTSDQVVPNVNIISEVMDCNNVYAYGKSNPVYMDAPITALHSHIMNHVNEAYDAACSSKPVFQQAFTAEGTSFHACFEKTSDQVVPNVNVTSEVMDCNNAYAYGKSNPVKTDAPIPAFYNYITNHVNDTACSSKPVFQQTFTADETSVHERLEKTSDQVVPNVNVTSEVMDCNNAYAYGKSDPIKMDAPIPALCNRIMNQVNNVYDVACSSKPVFQQAFTAEGTSFHACFEKTSDQVVPNVNVISEVMDCNNACAYGKSDPLEMGATISALYNNIMNHVNDTACSSKPVFQQAYTADETSVHECFEKTSDQVVPNVNVTSEVMDCKNAYAYGRSDPVKMDAPIPALYNHHIMNHVNDTVCSSKPVFQQAFTADETSFHECFEKTSDQVVPNVNVTSETTDCNNACAYGKSDPVEMGATISALYNNIMSLVNDTYDVVCSSKPVFQQTVMDIIDFQRAIMYALNFSRQHLPLNIDDFSALVEEFLLFLKKLGNELNFGLYLIEFTLDLCLCDQKELHEIYPFGILPPLPTSPSNKARRLLSMLVHHLNSINYLLQDTREKVRTFFEFRQYILSRICPN